MYFLSPLTPRVKPCVIESLLTFDSMDRTPKCKPLIGKLLSDSLLWCCLCIDFPKFVISTTLDLALSGVRELNDLLLDTVGRGQWRSALEKTLK